MKDFFSEILTKKIRYSVIISFMISSLLLILLVLYLPYEMLFSLNLDIFFSKYSGFILTSFFISFFLFVAQLIPDIYIKVSEKIKKNKMKKFLTENKKSLYEDEAAWNILLKIYNNNNNPYLLVSGNQKVKLMENFGMIVKTNNQSLVSFYDFHEAEYPYILQPGTEKYIREFLENKEKTT